MFLDHVHSQGSEWRVCLSQDSKVSLMDGMDILKNDSFCLLYHVIAENSHIFILIFYYYKTLFQ